MGGDFRTESGSLVDNAPDNYEALCQQAKTLLEEAGGVKAVGQITLLYDTSDETATNTAMAVRDAWKHQLGIIAVMRGATAQELAEAVNRGEYIVALTTLTADRGDASGLLSWWQSGSSFHSTAYVMLLRQRRPRAGWKSGTPIWRTRSGCWWRTAGSFPCTIPIATAAWAST